MKIKNRESASNTLAAPLKDILKKVSGSDIIVLELARVGFVMAEVIARKLGCSLDMMISKRLSAPHDEEMANGAVAEDGTTYLNKTLIEELKISDEYIDKELFYQLQEKGDCQTCTIKERKPFLMGNTFLITIKQL